MPTILVVEDEPAARKFIAKNLKVRGYDVLEAEDGESGLQQARDFQPAAILLDLKLPLLDGWEFLDALQVDSYQAIVVLITALDIETDEKASKYPQVVETLIKPISAQELLNIMGRLVPIEG